jgi:kynurenine formamidase
VSRFTDLSHPIAEGMETYRPLPTPRAEVLNDYDCEHMTNLAAASTGAGRLHAVPIAWVGGATFPVRAYLVG